MSILSVQSHVAYGYVGNKVASFILQSLGYDVWQVNTVLFSNHTGYGKWQGEILNSQNIENIINGIKDLGVAYGCNAILSGYLGSAEIGEIILKNVREFKQLNSNLVYLCDPVMGDLGRGFFVSQDVVQFFNKVKDADIITPNHFEMEQLIGKKILTIEDAKDAADFFHDQGVKIVVITSFELKDETSETQQISIFVSNGLECYIGTTPYYEFEINPNGTGDLFSALFLGYYLKEETMYNVFYKTLYSIHNIMKMTWQLNQRELFLLNYNYRFFKQDSIIKINKLF